MNRSIRDAIEHSISALTEAGVPFEALAEYEPARRRLFFAARARFRPLGQVWRLGVLLLSADGTVHSVGTTTRAIAPRHPNNQSLSAETRRHFRETAFRGRFTDGQVVNFDTHPVDWTPAGLRNQDSSVWEADGRILVRWRPGADATNSIPFTDYLNEKVALATANTSTA